MPYYTRIFGKSDPDISLDFIYEQLKKKHLKAQIETDPEESPDNWTWAEVSDSGGDVFMVIERNPVIEGELGNDELEEFKEFIQKCKPDSAVKWLLNYFENVKVIYAFQLLNSIDSGNNFDVADAIRDAIRSRTGGISQADLEGFTNEDGYHILWQFSDDVSGHWNMAVLNERGEWDDFVMELSNTKHRAAFFAGKVP